MAHRILTSLVGIDATFSSTLSLTSLAGVGNRMLIVNSAGTVSTQAIPVGTVTSVGLSMPSAFTVSSSPVTGSGTLTVTGAGTTAQYIDGTGALQTFPTGLPTSFVRHQVKAGVAINKGQAVYVTSADGTNMVVGLASNTSEATSSKTMGLLDATVAINGFANVVTEGLLAGLDTSTAGAAGDPVWLGTNGNLIFGLTNKPYAPAHLVFIGIVTRKNLNNGEIFIKVQNGFELKEIHDVDLITTTPINGHLLGFDGTLWVNKTIAGWLGYTPLSGTGTTNYVPKWTGSTALGNSLMYDNGTTLLVGTTTASTDYSSALLALSKSNNLTYQEIRGSSQATLVLTQGVTANSTTPAVEIFNGYNFGIKFIGGTGGAFSNYPLYYYAGDGAGTGDYVMMQAGGSERLRIASNGNVQIGTTTNAGYKLDINGTLRAQGKLTVTTGGAEITGTAVLYSGAQSYGQVQIFSAAAFQMFNAANNSKASFQYINANGLLLTTNSDNISGVLKGLQVNPTMVAAANNDVLVGLDISPTFTVGAFTGVTTLGLRVQSGVSSFGGNVIMNGNNFYLGGNFGNTVIRTISTTNVQIFNNNAGATLFLNANGSVQIGQSSATNWALFSASGHTIYNTTNTYFFSTGNVGINQSSDAGYKLDIGGTTRFQGNIAQSSGTATFANGILLDSTSRIFSGGTITYQSNSATSQHLFKNDISSTLSGTIVTITNTSGAFGVANPSNFLNITGRLATASGTNNLTSILLNHTVENTGTYTGTIRGIYYNPSSIVGTGFTHRAIETTTGDVLFGTTSGVVGIGTTTIGTEANLYLGAKSTTEGGQLILQKGTSQTYATHLDNYTDQFRILYGTDTGSTGVALAVAMSNRQLILPAYTTTSSFSGTVVGYLAFDSAGNVLTVTTPSGAVTSVNAGTGVSVSSTTGNVTVSIGQSVATSATPSFDQVFATNNGNGTNFKVGDDAWIGDVNTADTLMVMGQQNAANGYIIFGNSNFTALGRSGTGALTYGGYTIYHSNNSNTITALGTITTGVWNGTAITDTYISSASTWNAKQNALTLTTTGTSGAATLVGATLNIPQYQSALTNPVTGTGTTNYVTKWTSSSAVGSSVIYDDGTNIGIGTTTPTSKFNLYGGTITVSSSTTNRTTRVTDSGFYLSRTSDGGYPSSITANGTMYYDTRNSHIFRNDGTVSMTIVDNTRNVLIGTSTDAGFKLDVNGSVRSTQFWQDASNANKFQGIINQGGATQSVVGINATRINAQTDLSVGFAGGADASAVIQANSTTKGFLPPRMTAAQRAAILTPATGLVVYQTDGVEGLYVYTSSGWKALTMV